MMDLITSKKKKAGFYGFGVWGFGVSLFIDHMPFRVLSLPSIAS